jgi:hypothetical protein
MSGIEFKEKVSQSKLKRSRTIFSSKDENEKENQQENKPDETYIEDFKKKRKIIINNDTSQMNVNIKENLEKKQNVIEIIEVPSEDEEEIEVYENEEEINDVEDFDVGEFLPSVDNSTNNQLNNNMVNNNVNIEEDDEVQYIGERRNNFTSYPFNQIDNYNLFILRNMIRSINFNLLENNIEFQNILFQPKKPTKFAKEEDLKKMEKIVIEKDCEDCEDECCICLEKLHLKENILLKLPCSHIFHQSCISKWLLENKDNCPICRFQI